MSKWAALLERKYALVLPCDNSDESDKTFLTGSHGTPFVPSVHFVTERKEEIEGWHEDYEERAAIMEFDGGITRWEAEAAAFKDCKIRQPGRTQ